jgi:hypothetical protein
MLFVIVYYCSLLFYTFLETVFCAGAKIYFRSSFEKCLAIAAPSITDWHVVIIIIVGTIVICVNVILVVID